MDFKDFRSIILKMSTIAAGRNNKEEMKSIRNLAEKYSSKYPEVIEMMNQYIPNEGINAEDELNTEQWKLKRKYKNTILFRLLEV